MSFQPLPNGTYGRPQPRAVGIWRLVGDYLLKQAHSTRATRFRGVGALALTTIGAKSGLERGPVPVGFVRDGDDWIITATAAGATHHPSWYFNLAAHPDRATIVTNGERIRVTATQLSGEELARVTAEVRAKSSRMTLRTIDRYRAATDRELPLIRLRRAPAHD
ncbi:MAG TPA: nitroreductase/quinone reductase family protein [Microbacteriaceae bacterium]|nr:nitroreductase/quinone reductase family protein [Microbacteriaceae bacterium]